MTKIFSIANQKGGVGKTTTTINLGSALAQLGKKVLLVDMDPQGNCSRGVGLDINIINKILFDALVNSIDINKVVKKTSFKNLDILPNNLKLANFSVVISSLTNNPYLVLKEKLKKLETTYDYILIDCPPSLGLLTINALSVSDGVLVPVQCEFFAMEAIAQILGTVSEVKRIHNPKLEIEGFILTMYENRSDLSNEIAQEVRESFRDNTFISVIPRNISIPEATANLMPVDRYKPTSTGSLSYLSLAKEIIDHGNK